MNHTDQLAPPKTYHNSREWIVIIKATAWLVILFYGNPSLQGALVELIQRLG
jgi:hypothetical protein